MAENNVLLKWLRDAHAMESSAESILDKQLERLKDHPEVHRKVSDHLQVTRRQQTRVHDCIEQLGGDTSTLKEMAGKFSGSMQELSAAGADDELVKACISDYAFEHTEIASYRALAAAADVYDEPEIRRVCSEILAEEQDMASWLENHIPDVTRMHLSQKGLNVEPAPSKPGPEQHSGPSRPRA